MKLVSSGDRQMAARLTHVVAGLFFFLFILHLRLRCTSQYGGLSTLVLVLWRANDKTVCTCHAAILDMGDRTTIWGTGRRVPWTCSEYPLRDSPISEFEPSQLGMVVLVGLARAFRSGRSAQCRTYRYMRWTAWEQCTDTEELYSRIGDFGRFEERQATVTQFH